MPAMNGGEMTLEKTPSYFVTKSVPARVHNMSSDLRLIIVLRDPVTRAVSDYTQVSVSGVSNHTPLIVFSPSQLSPCYITAAFVAYLRCRSVV